MTTLFLPLVAVIVGALPADRPMPRVAGQPSHALPVRPEATGLDRVLALEVWHAAERRVRGARMLLRAEKPAQVARHIPALLGNMPPAHSRAV